MDLFRLFLIAHQSNSLNYDFSQWGTLQRLFLDFTPSTIWADVWQPSRHEILDNKNCFLVKATPPSFKGISHKVRFSHEETFLRAVAQSYDFVVPIYSMYGGSQVHPQATDYLTCLDISLPTYYTTEVILDPPPLSPESLKPFHHSSFYISESGSLSFLTDTELVKDLDLILNCLVISRVNSTTMGLTIAPLHTSELPNTPAFFLVRSNIEILQNGQFVTIPVLRLATYIGKQFCTSSTFAELLKRLVKIVDRGTFLTFLETLSQPHAFDYPFSPIMNAFIYGLIPNSNDTDTLPVPVTVPHNEEVHKNLKTFAMFNQTPAFGNILSNFQQIQTAEAALQTVLSSFRTAERDKRELEEDKRELEEELLVLQERLDDTKRALARVISVQKSCEERYEAAKENHKQMLSNISMILSQDTIDLAQTLNLEIIDCQLTHRGLEESFTLDHCSEYLESKSPITFFEAITHLPTIIQSTDGEKYIAGPFRITIVHDLYDNLVEGRIARLSHNSLFGIQPEAEYIYVHPHANFFRFCNEGLVQTLNSTITSSVPICFGDSQVSIHESMANLDIARLLYTLDSWLRSAYTADAWGKSVVFFPRYSDSIISYFNQESLESLYTLQVYMPFPQPTLVAFRGLIEEIYVVEVEENKLHLLNKKLVLHLSSTTLMNRKQYLLSLPDTIVRDTLAPLMETL